MKDCLTIFHDTLQLGSAYTQQMEDKGEHATG